MLSILERLDRRISWQLLAPSAGLPPGIQVRRSPEHARCLERLRATRAQVFGTHEPRSKACAADEAAAHLIALDTEGEVAGAVRLFLVDRQRDRLCADLLASFGRIRFPDESTARHQLGTLDAWLRTIPEEPRFVYPGGFFTTPAWRNTALAATLGMAAIAWSRLQGCTLTVSFASVEGTAAKFFSLLGALQLIQSDGQALPPFLVPGYDIHVRIVRFDCAAPRPRIEGGVQAMQCRLTRMTALAPPRGVADVNVDALRGAA